MNYEKAIKEARTIEAMRNGYMGLGGKFCQITKKLGFPIINQGGLYLDSTEFEDVFKEENKEEIRTANEDESTYEVGWQFDGLSRGINLSITIKNHLREIIVRHEGNIVYKEVSGELEGYHPDKVWEEWINKLHETVKKSQRKESIQNNKKIEQQKEEKKLKILDDLKRRWGI